MTLKKSSQSDSKQDCISKYTFSLEPVGNNGHHFVKDDVLSVVVDYVNQLLKCVSYRVTEVEYLDTASYYRARSMISFERIEKWDE